MLETITIITLCLLYLVFFRPGKTPVLNSPLVIDRPGKYHVTLAPHLNLAQPFIEDIAKELTESDQRTANSSTQYFEIKDKQVRPHGQETYLLAITQRNGMFLFQAAAPTEKVDRVQAAREYVQDILSNFPASGESDKEANRHISSIAQKVAEAYRIEVTPLP